ARALAVSPPATLNASGKLLAENTPTTPTGTSMRRRSGRGAGIAAGSGWSMVTSRYPPSASTSANRRSWNAVRASSPRSRVAPSADSRSAAATIAGAGQAGVVQPDAGRAGGLRGGSLLGQRVRPAAHALDREKARIHVQAGCRRRAGRFQRVEAVPAVDHQAVEQGVGPRRV